MANHHEQELTILIEQTHENLKMITKSEIPAVRDLAIQMLALSKYCVAAVIPEKMEHIDDYE
jgi:hypothetical protein